MQRILIEKKNDWKRFCEWLNVKRLNAFGSAVSGEFRDDSDINFLISFAEDLTPEGHADNHTDPAIIPLFFDWLF